MKDENNIFVNKLTLKHKIKSICEEFYDNVNMSILSIGKVFNIILLLSSIASFVLLMLKEQTLIELKINWIGLSIITSIITLSISFITTIGSLICKNLKFQKICLFSTFILFTFPFNNSVEILTVTQGLSNTTVFIMFSLLFIRGSILSSKLITVPNCYYVFFIQFIFSGVYKILLNNPTAVAFTFLEICLQFIISYFITKETKSSIYINYLIKEKNKWYSNLFEHFNSGFISFKNKKINIINKCLIDNLSISIDVLKILDNRDYVISDEKRLVILDKYQRYNNKIEKLKNNSEKILEIILSGLNENYNDQENKQINDKNIHESIIIDEGFSLENKINNLKNLYFFENLDEKFLFLGYKELEVEVPVSSNNTNNSQSLNNNDCFFNSNKKSEIRIFEVYIRCHDRGNIEEDEFEIIMNDISKVKLYEMKSAELKYKTVFLSKVAHEFKNPLICISELVNEIQENGNICIDKNSDIIKQLKSMSDYLLLLIKDLDYFSQLQIKNREPHLEINDIDIDETIDFSKKIAETLIYKFNKRRLKFQIENEIINYPKLSTDSIKLKQILINLISNSIKFTNEGYVKLILKLLDNDKLLFEIKDSGIGLTEKQISNINTPFNKGTFETNKYGSGLGLYIVTQMLSQMDSELKIISSPGSGSSFSFCFNILSNDVISQNSTLNLNSDYSIILDKNKLEEFRKTNGVKRCDSLGILKQSKNSFKNLNILKYDSSNIDKGIENYIIVDDERFTRLSTVKIIKRCANKMNRNINILEAEDGIECLYHVYNLIQKGMKISAIISDEMMNHMNGTFLAETLRKLKNMNSINIPFYLLTALPDVDNLNISEAINKPLSESIAFKILDNI